MNDVEKKLALLLPSDDESTATDHHYLNKLPELLDPEADRPIAFLDLGAGHGGSKRIAERVIGSSNVDWRGVDIDSSDEHLSRPENAPPVDLYDGVNLPYENDAFDVIWCKQVLEHVRHPDAVIAEVSRTLKPSGLFIGSVSQLEPYHSRSIFNWTHYGICVVLEDHGMDVIGIAPGADGVLLMLRSVFGYNTGLNKFFAQETPFNQILSALFEKDGAGANSKVAMRQKLKTAGHIHFAARKV